MSRLVEGITARVSPANNCPSSALLYYSTETTRQNMASAELRLADHFPRVHEKCKAPADKFFECFSEKGTQPKEGDAEAGRKGLAACANLMQNYDQCMTKIPAKSLVRVQEEYRLAEGETR